MHIDSALRPGLAFMTLHFPDEVETNLLTIEADGPEIRHGGVQGHGDPDREARRTAVSVPADAWTCI